MRDFDFRRIALLFIYMPFGRLYAVGTAAAAAAAPVAAADAVIQLYPL